MLSVSDFLHVSICLAIVGVTVLSIPLNDGPSYWKQIVSCLAHSAKSLSRDFCVCVLWSLFVLLFDPGAFRFIF